MTRSDFHHRTAICIKRTNDGSVLLFLDRSIVRCHAGDAIVSSIVGWNFTLLAFLFLQSHPEYLRVASPCSQVLRILLCERVLSVRELFPLLQFLATMRNFERARRIRASPWVIRVVYFILRYLNIFNMCFVFYTYFWWWLLKSTGLS